MPDPQRLAAQFPVGAAITVAELTADPHPALRLLRTTEPVSWLPALGGWLVTRADLAERVLRDPRRFTVDDPRFSTARVIGPSMLSLDGDEHRAHRDPFARALRAPAERERLADVAGQHAAELVRRLRAAGSPAELRRQLAGPLAVAVMAAMLGLDVPTTKLLGWYDAIVAGVSALSRGDTPGGRDDAAVPEPARAAFSELSDQVLAALTAGAHDGALLATAAATLPADAVVSNTAVLLFGGLETTEGMITTALWHLLSDAAAATAVAADPQLTDAVVEESLRLEPAAALVDRYATTNLEIGNAPVQAGDLVSVSLAGANRDPAVCPDPDEFRLHRSVRRQHWAFAIGPHFCIGAQQARAETAAAVTAVLSGLPGARLDPERPAAPEGLVFRKPPALWVRWDR